MLPFSPVTVEREGGHSSRKKTLVSATTGSDAAAAAAAAATVEAVAETTGEAALAATVTAASAIRKCTGGRALQGGTLQSEGKRPKRDSFSEKGLRVSKGALKLLQVNCRSVVNKEIQLWNLIEACDADVVIGTESWLTEEILDSEICRNDYKIFRRDRETRGGGSLF